MRRLAEFITLSVARRRRGRSPACAAAEPDAADRRADGLCGERSGCAVLSRGFPGLRSRSWGGRKAAISGSNFAGAPVSG